LLALKKGHNDAFNLGTGQETSVQEAFDTIEKYLRSGLKPIYGQPVLGDVPRTLLDTHKAQKVLGWKAKYTFDRGVKKTISYYKGLLRV
jgi:nucleoside-diphosphate-sugar epimerase